nr:cubilin-like [Lytechinus pictus]
MPIKSGRKKKRHPATRLTTQNRLTSGVETASAGSQTGGRVKLADGESFLIESPKNRWGDYDSGQDVLWRVKAPDSCQILIQFEYFSTLLNSDYVFIGNGTKKSDNPIWALSGYTTPSLIRMEYSTIWIRFYSRHFGRRGFGAHINATCNQDDAHVDTLGSGYKASVGETYQISSPNYPNAYSPDTRLVWGFDLPEPRNCRIYVTFLDFETDQDIDQVILGTLGTRGGVAKEIFSGDSVPLNQAILVQPESYSTKYAYVQFASDEIASMARGFMANVTVDCQPGFHVELDVNETYRVKQFDYPIYYQINTDEAWVIKVPHDCDISVEVARFDTQTNQDGLHIGTGTNISTNEILFLTGNTVPRFIDIPSNIAWFRFVSDDDDSSRHNGFDSHVTPTCRPTNGTVGHHFDTGGSAVALHNGDVYSISSPNYPIGYEREDHLVWLFRIPEDCQLRIVFNDFLTEGIFDKVSIRTTDSLLHEFYGEIMPGTVTVNSTVTIIKFDNDFSGGARGFQADLTPVCGVTPPSRNATVVPVIEPIEPLIGRRGLPIRVTCTAKYGDLPIYFRWFKDGGAIPHGIGVDFVNGSFSNSMVITDVYSVHDGQYTCEASNSAGVVNYETSLTVEEHVVELGRDETIHVRSPMYGWYTVRHVEGFYTWVIKAPENCTVLIKLEQLGTLDGKESLEIGTGYNTSNNKIWSLYGIIPFYFNINSSVVWLWFRSETHESPGSRGFGASVSSVCDQAGNEPYIDTRGSGVSLSHGESYTIASPNFPENFPSYTSMNWLFKLPEEGCQLTIDLMNFTTRSEYETLNISSTAGLEGPRLQQMLLYGDLTIEPIEITTTSSLIQFKSRSSYGPDVMRGFKAVLHADCETDTSHPIIDAVGSNVSLASGDTYYISSLNYPYANYPRDQDVIWRFFLPKPTCQLMISFMDFELYRYTHKLSISSTSEPRDTLIELTADDSPGNITLTSDYVIIHFEAGSFDGERGFMALVSSLCIPDATPEPLIDAEGGSFNLSDGQKFSISSPNYPYGRYPERQDITWSFYLPHQNCRLNITFQDFHTESGYDKVYIRWQNTEKVYSGDVIPDPVYVRSDYIVIRFTSDFLTGFNGFGANLVAECQEEVEIVEEQSTCSPDQFTCLSGNTTCIPISPVC